MRSAVTHIPPFVSGTWARYGIFANAVKEMFVDTISILQLLVTTPIGMFYIAPMIDSRARGLWFKIALLFVIFFFIKHIHFLERFEFVEAAWRSVVVALVPILVGYFWARLFLPQLRKDREFLSSVPTLKSRPSQKDSQS